MKKSEVTPVAQSRPLTHRIPSASPATDDESKQPVTLTFLVFSCRDILRPEELLDLGSNFKKTSPRARISKSPPPNPLT